MLKIQNWANVIAMTPVLLMAVLAHGVTLQNESLRIEFAEAEDGYSCMRIVNRLADDATFVNCCKGEAGFWQLVFRGNSESVTIDNLSPAKAHRIERSGDMTTFVWEGVELPDGYVNVQAKIRLDADGASRWFLNVDTHSKSFALSETIYPLLACVTQAGKGDLLIPHSNLGAKLIKRFSGPGKGHPWIHPYMGYQPMVAAFNLGDAGLYFAAEDPEARFKKLVLQGNQSVCFRTWVENAGVVDKSAEGPKYPVCIAAYKGDWWQAARRYRKWALGQFWAAKGPIIDRVDYPRTMSETPFWMNIHGHPPAVSNMMTRVHELFPDFRAGVHWHLWQHFPNDQYYPEYFPEQPGVKQTIEYCKRIGAMPMPHTNGRLFDALLQCFTFAKHFACIRSDGNPYVEHYGKSHPLVPMCPFTPEWQVTISNLADRITGELGAKAIFIDQIGAAGPCPCYNPAHGHPLGGGTYWATGYQKMLSSVHDVLSARGAIVTTEGTAETYLNVVDGFLVVTLRTGEDVPFYPAVYSGYTTYFGTLQNMIDTDDAFYAMQAREFLWGCVNGWYDRAFLDEKYAIKQQMVRQLCRARMVAKDWLAYGTLLDELRPNNELPKVRCIWSGSGRWQMKDQHVEMPAVIGSVWEAPHNGKKAVVAVNITAQEQTVEFDLPTTRSYKYLAIKGETASRMKQNGKACRLVMPPRAICVLCEVVQR